MMMDLIHSVDAFFDALGPWWLEACFVIAFPLGYYFLEVFGHKPAPVKSKFPKVVEVINDGRAEDLQKKVEDAVAASDMIGALKQWRKVEAHLASSSETLKLVVQALCSVSPATLVDEVAKHLETHRSKLCNGKTALIILDAVGHGQPSELLDEVCEMLRGRLGIPMTYQLYEVLVAGHAFADNSKRIDEICEEIKGIGQKLTARAFALIIKGFLCKSNLDVALKYTGVMRSQGFYVPPFAVSLLFKVAAEVDRVKAVFEACLDGSIMMPHETIAFAFEDCFRRRDLALASCIEACCRCGGELPATAFDPLLKVNVMACDNHAFDLWEEMVKTGVKITEGLCVGILARSAESKFLRFAEEVAKYCREKCMMSIAVYSALMKVYAYSGFYGRACDLYPEIIASGLTPDAIMYGCLMHFAVECGRTELSQELSGLSPQLVAQNYMSLIRAAGRDKDTDRAFQLLEKLKGAGGKVDLAMYNCVLDACVCAGDLARARELTATMREKFGRLDLVSYNTMLKGHTLAGEISAAYTLLSEMEWDGVTPNDISYNSIVNSAVSIGDFKEAWRAVDRMHQKGIKPDHYTVSIMLKALKRHGSSNEARKVFAMVDQLGIDVCSEEVLFSTLLEVCLHLHETRRLQELLADYGKAGRKPSQHLYGALIKASSVLKQVHKCREYWQDMVQERAMMPNEIVLGCMLDALVCNGEVSEAVALFREWKPKVGGNMVLYSTLVKGFAAAGRSAEAMELWQEIRAEGTQINTVVYNCLIDAQARKGMTEEIATLFAAMKSDNIPADSITYSTMVKAHCVKNDMQKALEVLKDMQFEGLLKDCIVFNTILDYCTKNNQMSVADRVLEDFEKLKIPPSNFTVGILVKMYGRRRMLDKAFQVAEDMPKRWGFSPNPQVYTCLMSACFLNNNLPRALKVFEDLRGQGADFKSYNVLITGFLRAGKAREAVGLVEEAYGLNGQKRGLPHGQSLGNEILEQIIVDLSKHGLAEQVALPLVSAMHEAGVPVNSRLLTLSIRTNAKMEESKTGSRPAGRGRQQQAKQ